MKQWIQYFGAFLGLWALFQLGIWLGVGEYLKLLPPITYLVILLAGGLRVFLCTVLLGIESLLHYIDRSAYLESFGRYETRLRGYIEAKLANACVVTATILASTQTRPWIFCVYAVAVFVLLGIGDDAFKNQRKFLTLENNQRRLEPSNTGPDAE